MNGPGPPLPLRILDRLIAVFAWVNEPVARIGRDGERPERAPRVERRPIARDYVPVPEEGGAEP